VSNEDGHRQATPEIPAIAKKEYRQELYDLWIELVKLQKDVIANQRRIVVVLEGRDAAGKDGVIKRMTKHLSPREVRIVALGAPSDREESEWYFQRFVPHLPAAAEIVLFNRSWYNRAGVERVMGFCTPEQYEEFLEMVPYFEQMLVRSGIELFKYYLDITREEQKERLESRREDPLKQWKISPIDSKANKLWEDYSVARDAMLSRTHTPINPWTVVRANIKRQSRLNLIKDFLQRIDYAGKSQQVLLSNPDIVFNYSEAYLKNGMIAP
jgi:polyphosphate kinase 2